MRSTTRAASGILVFLLCGALSLLAMAGGLAVFGKDPVGAGCATRVVPPVGGPWFEDRVIVRAERTWFPLGAVCALDSPHDRLGPQTVRLQSWPSTVVWLLAATAAVVGAVAAIRAVLPGGRQRKVSGRSSAAGS